MTDIQKLVLDGLRELDSWLDEDGFTSGSTVRVRVSELIDLAETNRSAVMAEQVATPGNTPVIVQQWECYATMKTTEIQQ